LLSKSILSEAGGILLMTGFCGGFTTFSAFSYESIQLFIENKWLLFFTYIMISVAGGIIATYIGFKLFN
jgi:CrcB protein